MVIALPGLPRGYRYPQIKGLNSFAGGLNIRDAASELAQNEVIDCFNITFDERGGAANRLGYTVYNATVYGAGLVQNVFWSGILSTTLVQAGANLYRGVSNTVVHTFTTSALVTFAELNSLVIACHPVDGLFTSPDGTVWTAVSDPDAPKGTCVAVWQNKLFVGKPNGSVQWSAPGDATAWTATDFNDIWEKDGQPIMALHSQLGEDFPGNPGLLVYKNDSCYRINDSTTGSYTTIDYTYGAANPLAVVAVGAGVYSLNRHGIFLAPTGSAAGLANMSDKLAPLWDPGQINLAEMGLWRAGRWKNRALFSLTRAGSTANDLALELHTEQGWIAPHSNAMSCYATTGGNSDVTYGGSPTAAGQVYQVNVGGTDNGAPISYRLQTLWMDLLGGFSASVLHVRVRGRGSALLEIRKDYHESGDSETVDMSEASSVDYDTGLLYDTGTDYYVPSDEPTAAVYSIGACRQLSLLFTGSTSGTVSEPQVLGQGAAPQVGSFAVFLIEAMFMRIGIN